MGKLVADLRLLFLRRYGGRGNPCADRSPIVQTASNLPSRSVRPAYDYVLSEGSPENYEEFIRLYPHDPLCDRIRVLLGNLLEATAWHKAVLANSPVVYKSFHDNYGNSPYAKSALKLQAQPKTVPLMQFTHLDTVAGVQAESTSASRRSFRHLEG